MGDPARFRKFAELVKGTHPRRDLRIVDVAAGKGALQANLRQEGYTDIVSFDKRKRCARPRRFYRYAWFQYNCGLDFDLVLAMHPDEGTDHAILYAAKHRVPFLVCPCCILPSASLFWDRKNFAGWVAHLTALASQTHAVEEVLLPIAGKNLVLKGTPRRQTHE